MPGFYKILNYNNGGFKKKEKRSSLFRSTILKQDALSFQRKKKFKIDSEKSAINGSFMIH